MALHTKTVLERNRLFQGLPSATLEQIAALAIRRVYADGAVVFSQGDAGDAFYGVVTGKIRISVASPDGKEMYLNIMEAGDSFGEIALLDGRQRTATAIATTTSELISIRRDDFLALLPRQPILMSHLLELLCQRIRWTSGLAEDYALLSVPARLARRLLALGRMHVPEKSRRVVLGISQEELARFLGLSRQVVNQYLQHWRAKNWIELGRGKITIIDDTALRRLIASSEPGG